MGLPFTVATETCFAARSWTGAETSFAAGFSAQQSSDVKVYARATSAPWTEQTLHEGVHFAVTLGIDGAVTIVPIALPAPPRTILILRDTPALQPVDFADLNVFTANIHTTLHSSAALRAAEDKFHLRRALLAPLGDTIGPLPPTAARAAGGAGSVAGYDDDGNPIAMSIAEAGALAISLEGIGRGIVPRFLTDAGTMIGASSISADDSGRVTIGNAYRLPIVAGLAGQSLAIDTGGDLFWAPPGGIISVLAFGAVPGQNCRLAVAAAVAAGHRRIHMPAGCWYQGGAPGNVATLIPADVELIGDGIGSLVKAVDRTNPGVAGFIYLDPGARLTNCATVTYPGDQANNPASTPKTVYQPSVHNVSRTQATWLPWVGATVINLGAEIATPEGVISTDNPGIQITQNSTGDAIYTSTNYLIGGGGVGYRCVLNGNNDIGILIQPNETPGGAPNLAHYGLRVTEKSYGVGSYSIGVERMATSDAPGYYMSDAAHDAGASVGNWMQFDVVRQTAGALIRLAHRQSTFAGNFLFLTAADPGGTFTGNFEEYQKLGSQVWRLDHDGNVKTGRWQASAIGLAYGGTGADLSATGGPSQVLKQATAGAAVTVGHLGVTDLSGLGAEVAAWLQAPSSANLAAAVTDETGSGSLVFAASPTFTTQITSPIVSGGSAAGASLVLRGSSHASPSGDAVALWSNGAAALTAKYGVVGVAYTPASATGNVAMYLGGSFALTNAAGAGVQFNNVYDGGWKYLSAGPAATITTPGSGAGYAVRLDVAPDGAAGAAAGMGSALFVGPTGGFWFGSTWSAGNDKGIGTVNVGNAYYQGGTKVVGSRDTGWTASTGAGAKSGVNMSWSQTISAAYTKTEIDAIVTQVQAITKLAGQLQAALTTHGLIGP